jgi:hypothetical protein
MYGNNMSHFLSVYLEWVSTPDGMALPTILFELRLRSEAGHIIQQHTREARHTYSRGDDSDWGFTRFAHQETIQRHSAEVGEGLFFEAMLQVVRR